MSTSTLPTDLTAPGPIYTVDQVNAGSDTILVDVPNEILISMCGAFVYCPPGHYQLSVEVATHWYFDASGGTRSPGALIVHVLPGQMNASPLLFPPGQLAAVIDKRIAKLTDEFKLANAAGNTALAQQIVDVEGNIAMNTSMSGIAYADEVTEP